MDACEPRRGTRVLSAVVRRRRIGQRRTREPRGSLFGVRFPRNPHPARMTGAGARFRLDSAAVLTTDSQSRRRQQPIRSGSVMAAINGQACPADPARASRDEERDDRPTSSGRQTGQRAVPAGEFAHASIVLHALVPRPAWKTDRPRRHAVDADIIFRQLLRHRLGEADFRRFHGVVRHAAARFTPPDRRDHHDRAAATPAHLGHGHPGRADGWEERLVERLMPLRVGRMDDVGALREADVVDENIEAAESLDGSQDHVGDTLFGGKIGLNRQGPPGAALASAAVSRSRRPALPRRGRRS